jgi:tetratricopeptide (TPR) repeat protein
LSWAAFGLRTMGRLREAVQPMKAGLEMNVKEENWMHAATNANNLSGLLLTLGDVHEAVEAARQSVSHADRSGDEDWKYASRTTLADALHQSGEITEAEKCFREAEAPQKKRRPEFPFLFSLPGYRFCDLLLGQGHYHEVMERAAKALEIVLKGSRNLLDIALNKLSLGRVWMISALEKTATETPQHIDMLSLGMTFLEEAVEGMREANHQEFLACGLLSRAEGYRYLKDYARAMDDLAEALDIAELGGMKLFICDYHLEAGRLCQAQGMEKEAL